ncbi:MAG: efflux RND transporter permease subunit [Rhodobacteraceae bacterium]|nr:efflux RND transporter permease subunit [Paracoccaceae bacterium]
MTGIVDWAASRARMVIAFVFLSLTAGMAAYIGLPKEGEPDIDIPGLFISVPFPGISAEDSERLLIRPMEAEFQDIDGLLSIRATASEGFGGVFLEFEFGWDKSATIADVRDAMGRAETEFPDGAESWQISEINFSEFPIIIVALSGDAPERTLLHLASDMQDRLEALPPILEAGLAGDRAEMLEVIIDPLALEAYNVTATDLIGAVVNNNQLIAAGEVETENGAISVKIPSSFDNAEDVYNLAISVNGDRVVTLGELADIRLTFEDRAGTARFNGETTVALQVVKRQGFNVIDTAALVRAEVEAVRASWPRELQDSVRVSATLDQSLTVAGMVRQLEGSVLTAIALVMIVVLAALGTRSAMLVGFAIPTSFLLCFILLGVMGIAISNIVMFGLILAVGMLVDGAIVVVEYADKRLQAGARPMQAYTDAAKRMFWPIVSSTATTLCAFLPMLFWPGVPGEFMGMLPVTLIFVLSASLIVALIYLPVLGGVAARFSRLTERGAAMVRNLIPGYWLRLVATCLVGYCMFMAAMITVNPGILGLAAPGTSALVAMLPGALMFITASVLMSVFLGSVQIVRTPKPIKAGYRHTPFGWCIHTIVGNPVMPLVMIALVVGFVLTVFTYFGANNNGVEFFVETEPENAVVYVRARGNLSVDEMDALVRHVEEVVLATEGVRDVFAFSGDGGLNNNTGGAAVPADTIGQVQMDLAPWGTREDGNVILNRLQTRLAQIPGIQTEIFEQANGPAEGKPVNLRLFGDDWDALQEATRLARAHFETVPGLTLIEDTLPLPGIDWELNVDVEAAGRYGASVATVGAMVQLVTRGILLDTMRVPTSDEEIDIRVRFPRESRVLSTLDSLRVRTGDGLVPLSNFVTYQPTPQLAEINRIDQSRYFEVRADVEAGLVAVEAADGQRLGFLQMVTGTSLPADYALGPDRHYRVFALADGVTRDGLDAAMARDTLPSLVPVNANERIAVITDWLSTGAVFPDSVSWEWAGDQEDQAESQAFLGQAFIGALGLMFIILLAQFNSVYNAVLVLLAVVLSTTGVLVGMLVMDQTFSIIMTGTGIVALAGIVVNNNIVLIDTYQEYARYMPRLEAITRTVEARIRPVLLTTITTMAGLTPMMYGISLDFGAGGYTINSPTALWWKQLATAVVFGLGLATVLTLIFTPSALALRVWSATIMAWIARTLGRLGAGAMSRRADDWALARAARRTFIPELLWDPVPGVAPVAAPYTPSVSVEVAMPPAHANPGAEVTQADESTDPEPDMNTPPPPLKAAE